MLRALSSEQHFKSLEHEGKGIGAPPPPRPPTWSRRIDLASLGFWGATSAPQRAGSPCDAGWRDPAETTLRQSRPSLIKSTTISCFFKYRLWARSHHGARKRSPARGQPRGPWPSQADILWRPAPAQPDE